MKCGLCETEVLYKDSYYVQVQGHFAPLCQLCYGWIIAVRKQTENE